MFDNRIKTKSQSRLFWSHKVELRTTASQSKYLSRCAGTMRFVYNSLVAKWKAGEKYNRKTFQKHCSTLRQTNPWMQEVSSRATYEAADNFHRAAINFFASCKGLRKGKKAMPPKLKKKGHASESVRFSHSTQFSVTGRHLRVGGLAEQIRMRENIRFIGAVKSVTIKIHAGKWFATFLVESEAQLSQEAARKPSVGVDLGISSLAVLSTGERIENPQPLRRKLRLLRRRQRQVSRKFVKGQKQSNRYKIASQRVARLHKQVCDQRSAAQHKFTSGLVKRFDRIVIEDLAVSNVVKNRKLSRAISDAGFALIRRQLEYKCKAAGVGLVIAGRFFASSQTCSGCGQKLEKKLSLAQRTFTCPKCLISIDRDHNAAVNLNNWKSISAPPIRGSSLNTDALGTVSRARKSAQEPSEGVNIHPKGSPPVSLCETMVGVY